jgi:hypothetical protein
MNKIIAYCGLCCNECPAYIAKKTNNDELRKKTAEEWSKMFNSEIKPEDVNCDSCLTKEGVIIQYCNVCEIRKCAQEKDVENCAFCEEYTCEKLEKWFKNVPNAKAVLDQIYSTR